MAIVSGIALESNKNIRVNFEGGKLSSDEMMLFSALPSDSDSY